VVLNKGDHPEDSLATFGYKTGYESNKKITLHFWLQARTQLRNLLIYFFK
jgi:hypothetical protein